MTTPAAAQTYPRLSLPTSQLQTHYDAVVVGSGYGGGIAAARLSRAGLTVCVLERGRELQPGEYPNDTLSLAHQVQIDTAVTRLGSPQALFDFRVYDDINVAQGCGLGGTSLINAGIALRPDPRVLQSIRWPQALRAEGALDAFYARAEAMLRPAPYPAHRPALRKQQALARCAQVMRLPFSSVAANVNYTEFAQGRNHVGVPQQPCTACGDCLTGCNVGAKNTVLMNYLPEARAHGAQIFCGMQVLQVAPFAGAWSVEVQDAEGRAQHIVASKVILGAGTLGSTEILLRSRTAGLSLSPALGQRFSGNGDMVGLSYNTDVPVNAIGYGTHSTEGREPVGPCSTGIIDLRAGRPVSDGMIMVEGAAPGAFGKWLPLTLAAMSMATGKDMDTGMVDRLQEKLREWTSKLSGPYTGAIRNTQINLVVAHDDAAGEMQLINNRLAIRWPRVGNQLPFMHADRLMQQATRALGGTHIANPLWHALLGRKLITGHPLGGCAMADDAKDGVVNDRGQVFSGERGTQLHAGLYVLDGAMVPTSLGVNPLLAICALAERGCELLLGDNPR